MGTAVTAVVGNWFGPPLWAIIDLRTRKKDPVETVIGPMKTEMTSAAVLEGGPQGVPQGTGAGYWY